MSIHISSSPMAALNPPKTNKALITFSRAVRDALNGNPRFPAPSPTIAVLDADIAAFEDAETKAASRVKGAASVRDARRKKVMDDLRNLRNYVQSVAETQASAADAVATIESAFMAVKKVGPRKKPELEARNDGMSGTVILIARAAADAAAYYWQYSQDQVSWTSAPETVKASTEIAGLTPARTYAFRFRALTRTGQRDYSQVVTLLVH